MKELARIQFRGDTEAFEAAWNTRFASRIEYGVVTLYRDDPEYEHMRQFFAAFAQEHMMTWFERLEIEYSEQELESFELLTLHIIGTAGQGNNTFTNVYEIDQVCKICGRVEYNQVRNLTLDLLAVEVDPYEVGYFQHDFCETDFHETVVSEKVKILLEEHSVPGTALRVVEHISPDVPIFKPYYQLLVEPQIGPLVEPSRVQRLDRCEACKQHKQVLLDAWPGTKESEFYFPKSTYSGEWIMKTMDRFGRLPNFSSKLIISQQLYRLLKDHHVTGFWVQPAHLIE